jgi:hypothetical protein
MMMKKLETAKPKTTYNKELKKRIIGLVKAYIDAENQAGGMSLDESGFLSSHQDDWLDTQANFESEMLLFQEKARELKRKMVESRESERVEEGDKGAILPSLSDPPVVRIFSAPPYLGRTDGADLPQKLYELWEPWGFYWGSELIAAPEESPCNQSQRPMSLAQKISLHYFNPFNPASRNAMLVHSAGAGKSVLASLLASNLVRDDPERVVIWVTKAGLPHLGREGIKKKADFNVQQWCPGKTTVVEKVLQILTPEFGGDTEKTEGFLRYISSSDIEEPPTKLKIQKKRAEFLSSWKGSSQRGGAIEDGAAKWVEAYVLGAMGVQWVYMTYEQFAKVGKADKNDSVSTWNKVMHKFAGGMEERRKNPLYKCCVVIDEAHTIVRAEDSSRADLQRDMLGRMIKAKWRSDRKHAEPADACRYILLTATPVVDHPLDVVNLSLFLNPEAFSIDRNLHAYQDVNVIEGGRNFRTNKQKTVERFMKDHFQSGVGFARSSVTSFRQMIRGKVSLFNTAGDRGSFAIPHVRFVAVDLSLTQLRDASNCISLEGEGEGVTDEDGALVAQVTEGRFVYANGKLRKAKNDKGGVSSKKTKGEPGDAEGSRKCIQKVALWPTTYVPGRAEGKKGGKNNALTARKALGKAGDMVMRSSKELLKLSPVLANLIEMVSSVRLEDMNRLRAFYNRREKVRPKDQMRRMKQYIYVDTDGITKYSDEHGADLVVRALTEQLGFQRLNKKIDSKVVQAHSSQKSMASFNQLLPKPDPYMGMIVLDGYIHKHPAKLKELLDIFNSAENNDGRRALLIVNTRRLREGISLFGVGAGHMLGYFRSRADLEQAVYRIIRNCGRKTTPYVPRGGWRARIFLYTPTIQKKKSNMTAMDLLDAFDGRQRDAEIALSQMEDILRLEAIDSKLLENINRASREVQSLLRLSPAS